MIGALQILFDFSRTVAFGAEWPTRRCVYQEERHGDDQKQRRDRAAEAPQKIAQHGSRCITLPILFGSEKETGRWNAPPAPSVGSRRGLPLLGRYRHVAAEMDIE